MQIKKVLSLFNGFNGGQMALEVAGIKHDDYYSSETDKYANTIANALYPNTIQLGDINNWQDWAIDWGEIDVVMGGSPCQGFSFAGKQLAFDDPRSKLFFVFMDIVNFVKSINPSVKVLLENVRMKQEYKNIITDRIGFEPMEINSALLSAQNRKRLYWANWEFGQPKDLGIMLKDVLEDGDEEYFKGEALKGGHLDWWNKNKDFQLSKKYSALNPDKAITMTARQYASWNGNFVTVKSAINQNPIMKPNYMQYDVNGKGHGSQDQRAYYLNGKHATLTSHGGESKSKVLLDAVKFTYRKLTPRECARLQTIPEDKIDIMLSCGVSNSQLYKMFGNGWTIEVIAHILKGMINETKQ